MSAEDKVVAASEVQELPKATVVGNVQLGAQMPNGRTISVSCYLLAEDTRDVINERLDLYQSVIERQRMRAEVPELEAKREAQVDALKSMALVLKDLESKSRDKGGVGLTSQEKMTLQQMRVNIKKVNEDIEKGEKAIADLKVKAGLAQAREARAAAG